MALLLVVPSERAWRVAGDDRIRAIGEARVPRVKALTRVGAHTGGLVVLLSDVVNG